MKAQQGSNNKNTRVQLYWNTLIRIPTLIINFIISILVARLLDPRDFGIMGIAMMLIGYANIFSNFGFNDVIIQKGIKDKKTLYSIFTFNFVISTFLAICFFLASGLIADFFHAPECKMVIRVMSLVFIISSFPVIPTSILRMNMNFRVLVILDFAQSIMMSLITLFMAWRGFGYWSLVYGQLVPLIFVSIAFCVYVRFLPILYYCHTLMKDNYNFGGWNFFRVQMLFISQHVDRFVVGKWLGPVQLGFYDKALTLGTTPYNVITMNINSVMFSSFSLEKDNTSNLRESFKKSIALLSFINFPIYLGLIAIVPHFVYSMLGPKWAPMVIPFQIILVGLIFRSFMGLVTSLNVGIGRYKSSALRSLAALMVFSILCILFRNQNITVISICFMVFCIIEVILLMDLSREAISMNLYDIISALFPGFISSMIMFFATILSRNFLFTAYSLLNMFLNIFIGAVIYIICILNSSSSLAKEFRQYLLNDFRRFFSI